MSIKKLSIGIVWANPYNKNMGVAALGYSSLALITDILNERGIEHEISFVGSSKVVKDSLILNGEKIEFDNIKAFDFLQWKSFIKFLLFPKKYKTKQILNLDILLDIGEGDSFTDIYGDERFRKILNSKRFFYMMGKRQLLLPETIGPFNKVKNEKKAFSIMKKMDAVISRDQQSYNYTAKFLAQEKIFETVDIAFYLPFQKKIFDNKKINVGINISGLLWNGGYTSDNQFNLKTDYRKLIRGVLDFFSGMENIMLHIVPHVVPTDQAVEGDYSLAEQVLKKYPQIILPPRFETPIEAKSYISGLDFFSGARMHSCIAAFSSGVPVFPMAYSRKFNGLFKDTLEYDWLGDCVNDTEDVVLSNMIEAFKNRDMLETEIERVNKLIVKPRIDLLKAIISKNIE